VGVRRNEDVHLVRRAWALPSQVAIYEGDEVVLDVYYLLEMGVAVYNSPESASIRRTLLSEAGIDEEGRREVTHYLLETYGGADGLPKSVRTFSTLGQGPSLLQ
jgi:hypothetical protein